MQRKSERLFRIYQRLKTVPQTIDELFRWSNHVDLGIGRRTLYRYLEELESSIHEPGYEVIITNHETKEKRWQVVKNKRAKDHQRVQAIHSYYLLKNLSGKHIHSLSAGYLDELEQEFNQNNEPDHHNNILHNHLIVTGWAEANYSRADTEILLMLLHAIEKREYVSLEFLPQLSAEQPVAGNHEWSVHYIINHRGSLYVAAIQHGQSVFRFLEIESIVKAVPAKRRFRKHPSRSVVEKELSRRFGITAGEGPVYKIVVLFHASDTDNGRGMSNPFIEKRTWHSTQQFKYRKDGFIELHFKSQLNRELLGWLLMWMDHIKVQSPPQLISLLDKKLDDIKSVIKGRAPIKSQPEYF